MDAARPVGATRKLSFRATSRRSLVDVGAMNKRAALAGISLAVLALSCGGGDTTPRCTPGQTVACVGLTGCMGAQICVADGRTFAPCVCTGAPPPADAAVSDGAGPGAPPPVIAADAAPEAARLPVFPDT